MEKQAGSAPRGELRQTPIGSTHHIAQRKRSATQPTKETLRPWTKLLILRKKTDFLKGQPKQLRSVHTPEQRARTDRSHERRSPRPIAYGPEFGARSGFPRGDGPRDARNGNKKGL
ncbi:unnamed protein product [Sphagnum balticum]